MYQIMYIFHGGKQMFFAKITERENYCCSKQFDTIKLTLVLYDDGDIVGQVVCAHDVQLRVLVVADGELPDGDIEAPGPRHRLAPLVHQGPGGLPQLGELVIERGDALRSLLQRHGVHCEHHVCKKNC